MKKNKYFGLIWMFALAILVACEPYIDEKSGSGLVAPPEESEMDFSISEGEDDFHYNMELVSPQINGISVITFDLGNGSKVNGETAVGNYPLPGDYTVTMTIKTNGGSSSISKTLTTTETDYTIFTDPKYVFLTGGADDLDGKTWVVDAETKGHFGVGDVNLADGVGLDWWSADPFVKSGTGAYDDELTFYLNGFEVEYDNKGVSYAKGYVKDDPALASVYLNPRQNKDDWDVDYQTPVTGSWTLSERNGKLFLIIDSETPIFPGLDVGALNNEYEVLSISENYLELTCKSAYEDWTKWHFLLRNKAYEKPTVAFDVEMTAGAEVNEYEVSITNVDIPAGQSIDQVTVDFGNGTVVETTDYNEVISNVYMRTGTYPVKVTVATSVDDKESTFTATVAANHPDYVPFLLDEMVMYNDFSEVALANVVGQDCFVSVVANPSRIYPNRSSQVAMYSKTDNAWANANMQLPAGYRFDLRSISTFKIMVYGKAGDVVLLKLENTDWGGDAWMSGVELNYTIQEDNTWEVAEYDFAGVANNGSAGDVFTNDVSDPAAAVSHDFFDIIRIMLNPGTGEGTHEFYFDELSGPHVEGIKSAKIN
jgi:hypothetical protein